MSLPSTDSPDFLAAALAYTRRGWRVLPVIAGDKRPALARWPELATTDPRQVADWWIDDDSRNIGIATGAGSGFFVLDIDPVHGGDVALAELEQAHSVLPNTYAVRTPSGGTHYYFAVPDFEVTNSPGQLKGTGIDVRGEGGQVVAPPSVTAVGEYEVLTITAAPIVDAPAWLLELIKPRPLALVGGTQVDRIDSDDRQRLEQYVDRAVGSALREVQEARGGSRNQTLNDQVLGLAGIAAHDATLIDRQWLFEAMLARCNLNGYLRDDGRAKIVATFESAWTAGLTKPRRDWPPVDRHAGLTFLPTQTSASGLPVVSVSQRKHNELTDEVVGHLVAAGKGDPRIFVHGTELVSVEPPARTVALDANMLTYRADEVMHFEKTMPRGGSVVANLPQKVAETVLVLPRKPFPPLTRIAHAPYFSPSGRMVSAPGYDEESQTFHSPSLGLTMLPVPDEPTQAEVGEALAYVRTEVLHDFPFVADADRAHAIALMLLPFVRELIDGPTPLHNVEAPTRASGKDVLTSCLLLPGVGGRADVINAPATDEEWQKALLAYLRHTPQAVVIDNVNTKLSSGALCVALTEPEFSARVLGVSTSVTVPVRTVWAMTANNPKFSDEVARRTVRIRLDSGLEHPEDRGGFRHPHLKAWCREHRAELIRACCVMVQGWVRAGMPEVIPAKPFGSFERWHAVVGGLLDFLGVPGLLENKADFLAAGDDEADAWGQLVSYLRRDLLGEWSAADIAEVVRDQGIAIDLGRGDNPALRMGRELSKQRDRWHDSYQFERRTKDGRTLWRLVGKPNL